MTKNVDYEFQNLSKAQQDCLELIESLGIYELRALARVFGDNSPTTLKRNDHIKIVMDKIISGEDLKALPMRPGRPHKELSNIEGILAEISQICGKDYCINQTRTVIRPQKVVTFKQVQESVFSQRLNRIEIAGVLLEKSEREFFLIDQNSKKVVLVKKEGNEKLHAYDHITGSAVIMNADGEYILENIKTINFQDFNSYYDMVDPYEPTAPSLSLDFGNKSVMLGGRYLLKDIKFNENSSELKDMLKKLNANKIASLALVPNVMVEDVATIKSLGFDNVFMINYDESPLSASDTFNSFLMHVTRLQQQGLKMALFVQDVITLANFVDFTYKNNTKALMGHTEMAVSMIKQLMMLAKAGGRDKHTTLFITQDDADLTDQTYVSSVYKVSKRL